jgi:type II secretory pathway component PulJ
MEANRERGFTLLEGLFAIFMVFMVLGALTHTLSQAAGVQKNTKNMDQAIEELHALVFMKKDAASALSISQPTSGASADSLLLNRVDPDKKFGNRIDVIGDPLDPYETSETVDVEYKIEDGILRRLVSKPDGTTSAERLLRAETFRASLTTDTPPLLTLTLAVKGTRVTKTRELKVALRSI